MGQTGDFLRSVSVHFGSGSQNVLKLIFKSRRFVPFWVNVTQYGCQIWHPCTFPLWVTLHFRIVRKGTKLSTGKSVSLQFGSSSVNDPKLILIQILDMPNLVQLVPKSASYAALIHILVVCRLDLLFGVYDLDWLCGWHWQSSPTVTWLFTFQVTRTPQYTHRNVYERKS